MKIASFAIRSRASLFRRLFMKSDILYSLPASGIPGWWETFFLASLRNKFSFSSPRRLLCFASTVVDRSIRTTPKAPVEVIFIYNFYSCARFLLGNVRGRAEISSERYTDDARSEKEKLRELRRRTSFSLRNLSSVSRRLSTRSILNLDFHF